jgi:hypothetical protein
LWWIRIGSIIGNITGVRFRVREVRGRGGDQKDSEVQTRKEAERNRGVERIGGQEPGSDLQHLRRDGRAR